jgi:hypothetical protein
MEGDVEDDEEDNSNEQPEMTKNLTASLVNQYKEDDKSQKESSHLKSNKTKTTQINK